MRPDILERRARHPEVDWPRPLTFTAAGYNVHPKQVGVRQFPAEQYCPCQDEPALCGGPRTMCPIHDPVVAEGDWDA